MIQTNEEQKLIPQLRFPEFEGELSQSTLIGVSKSKLTNGVFNDPSKVGSGYYLINVKDMYSDLSIEKSKLSRLVLDEEEFNKNKVEYGDIFFTRSSLVKEGIAHSAINLSRDTDITFDGHLIKLSPDTAKVNPVFLAYYFKTQNSRKQFIARGKTGTMTTISQDDIASVRLRYPTPEEQQKIASFLTAVDQHIQLLEEKKKDLERYKKGAMQKLFPKKGEKLPEIRFKDENGKDFMDWEEKKLGEILAVGSGRDYKHLDDGDIPVYGTGGYMLSVNDYLYEGDSVCIGRKGTINKPMLLTGKFWTVDTLFYTHSYNGVKPFFLFLLFQKIKWKKYNEASGVPSLSKSTIEKIKIMIPIDVEEQQKIASFLSAIDEAIEKVGKQVEETKQFKKGLLQKMFV